MTNITMEVGKGPIVCIVQNMGLENLDVIHGKEISDGSYYTVFLNGT
jgi:hypothetical protein